MSHKPVIQQSETGAISGNDTAATKMQAEVRKNSLQFRRIIPMVLVPALVTLFCIYIMGIITDKPLVFFVDDPMETYDLPFYTGLLSNFSVILWFGTASSNYLGTRLFTSDYNLKWFFLASMAITLWLGLDDLFLLHDRVFEVKLHIPEIVFYLIYIVIFGVYLIYFRRVIMMGTNYFVLFIAMLFFITSMIIKAQLELPQLGIFIGDSFKFIGIAFLFYFYNQTIIDLSRRQR